MPDPERDFILKTDRSLIALGAVLKSKFDDTGLEHPIGFFSRSLTCLERNYVAYGLQMYAMVRAVEHFRMFILGKKFLLCIDLSIPQPTSKRSTPDDSDWKMDSTFLLIYITDQIPKWTKNVIADLLSRLPFAKAEECGATSALTAQPHLDSQTSATTCCEPDWSNLKLVNLERNDNFESEADTDESDTNLVTDYLRYGLR